MKNNATEHHQASLSELNEIFMVPSNTLTVERFSAENQAFGADCCGGNCGGSCTCRV